MIMIMAKKEAKTDGRADRYKPFTLAEIKEIGSKLGTMSGVILAACDDLIAQKKQNTVKMDGRPGILAAVALLGEVAKTIKNTAENSRLPF